MIPDRKRDTMLNENEATYAIDAMTREDTPDGVRHLAVLRKRTLAGAIPQWPDEPIYCCGRAAPPDAAEGAVEYIVAQPPATLPIGFCAECYVVAQRIVYTDDEPALTAPAIEAMTLLGKRLGEAIAEFVNATIPNGRLEGEIARLAEVGGIDPEAIRALMEQAPMVPGPAVAPIESWGGSSGRGHAIHTVIEDEAASMRVEQLGEALQHLVDAREDLRSAAKLIDLAGESEGGNHLRLMRAVDDVETVSNAVSETHAKLDARST